MPVMNHIVTDIDLVYFTKIDLHMFVIPFSVASSAATACWLFLCRERMFNNDPTWDNSLFETEVMWTYEIIHDTEIFCVTIALITTSSQPRSFQTHFYMACTLTALHIFFATTSRVSTIFRRASVSQLDGICTNGLHTRHLFYEWHGVVMLSCRCDRLGFGHGLRHHDSSTPNCSVECNV